MALAQVFAIKTCNWYLPIPKGAVERNGDEDWAGPHLRPESMPYHALRSGMQSSGLHHLHSGTARKTPSVENL